VCAANGNLAGMNRLPNAASVALVDSGRVLLIQRARAPYFGLWTLPGGRLEPGEDATACAIREIAEETGLVCANLMPVIEMPLGESPRPFILQVFVTADFGGEIFPSDEIAGHCWARSDELGDLPVTPRLPEVLERAFQLLGRR